MSFVWARTKLSVDVRCTKLTNGFLISVNGKPHSVTVADMYDRQEAEIAFLTAWTDATGMAALTVVRRDNRRRYRAVVLSFYPQGAELLSITRGHGKARIRWNPAPFASAA